MYGYETQGTGYGSLIERVTGLEVEETMQEMRTMQREKGKEETYMGTRKRNSIDLGVKQSM